MEHLSSILLYTPFGPGRKAKPEFSSYERRYLIEDQIKK